jgi:hypothetical protein
MCRILQFGMGKLGCEFRGILNLIPAKSFIVQQFADGAALELRGLRLWLRKCT